FRTPCFQVGLVPASVQANSVRKVFGKGRVILALTDEDIADLPPVMNVVDPASGLALVLDEAEVDLSRFAILAAVVPGLFGVHFGMMAARARRDRLIGGEFMGRIEIKDALTGIAYHSVLPPADPTRKLRAQHDLAGHALVIKRFRNAGSAEFGDSFVVAQ